jgi:hypothetical protein
MKKKRKKRFVKEYVMLYFLFLVLWVFVFGFVNSVKGSKEFGFITGRVTEASTVSSVVIQEYVAISLSNTLASGIDFGSIPSLPVSYHNASGNYDANQQTLYDILIDATSNINVDFCTRADGPLTTGTDTIPLQNYVWEDDIINDANNPGLPGNQMDINYFKGSTNVGPGGANYYRFWLNVDAGQPPGLYSNTIYFLAVKAGQPCQ